MSNFQLHSVFPTGIGDAIMHDVEYLGILKKDIISQYRKDEEKYVVVSQLVKQIEELKNK